MAIEVQCAACGKKLRAPESQAGRVGKCPACKSDILVPSLPPVAVMSEPSIGSALGQPERPRTTTPFASTLDDEYALPPSAGPAPFESDAGNSVAPVESKHWFALQGVLKITELALLVEWIACSVLGLGIIALSLMAGGSGGDVTTIQVLSVFMLWGVVGMLLGWAALVTGWLTCLMGWPADRKLLIGSAAAAGVWVFVVLVVVSFQLLGFSGSSPRGPQSGTPLPSSTAITVLGSLASCSSLILFSFFLNNVQQRLGREQIKTQPIIYAAVVGVLTLWCLIANLAISPTTRFTSWLLILSNLGMFITQYLWLWLINAFTSRDLRVNQAWKRL